MDCKSGCITINCCGEGMAPAIGENGNWWIGKEDTGVRAQGPDGIAPHIGENGNWFVGEEDTGVRAQGMDGPKGEPGAQGPKGDSGLMEEVYSTTATRIGTWIDGKPLYRRVFRYDGTIPATDSSVPNAEVSVDAVPASQFGNLNQVIRIYGTVINAHGNTVTFPNIRLSALYVPVYGIRMQSWLSNAASGLQIVVEYT